MFAQALQMRVACHDITRFPFNSAGDYNVIIGIIWNNALLRYGSDKSGFDT